MKHWERWIIYPLFVIIAIISLASLCQEYPRTAGFDYIGVIVGILTLLVTALIGGQVVNYLTFENRINRKIKDAKKEVGKGINDVLYQNMYLTFFFQGVNEFRKTQCEASLYYLFKSIECLMKTSIYQDKIDEVIMKIKLIEKDFPGTKIPKEEAENYIEIIREIKHKEINNIIDTLKKMSKA